MDTIRLDPHMLQEVLKKHKFSPGIVITFQVIAFSGMSPGYPDSVSTFP
jgi:hypothetical protein